MEKATFAPHVLIFYQDQDWFDEVELDITLCGFTVRGFPLADGYSEYLKKIASGNSDFQLAYFQLKNVQPENLKVVYPFWKHYYFAPKSILLKEGAAELKLRFMMDPNLRHFFQAVPPIVPIADLNGDQLAEQFKKLAPPAPKNKKIIILDEEDDFREELVEQLTQYGFEVMECDSAPFFLSQVAEQGKIFDFMVLDAELSGVSLIEVLENLKKTPNALAIPKLITGASKSSSDIFIKARALGANEILDKPYDLAQLLQQLAGFKYPTVALSGLDFLNPS